jgi:hypothetical protein
MWNRLAKKFILESTNDFINKTLGKTLMLKSSMENNDKGISDAEILKFAMSEIIRKSVWNRHSAKRGCGSKKVKKEQESV